jgi:CRP-like cAMP-binding protein
MAEFDNILKSIATLVNLTKDETDFFISFLKRKRFKKKQFLVQADEVCKYDFFISKGLVKEYMTDLNGKDFILNFVEEDDWTSDYNSYFTGKPAQINIEALEDTDVIMISYADIEILMKTYPVFEKCYRIYFQQVYSQLQVRLASSLVRTVEQRYNDFIATHPQLSQRVPQHQIALYLGVSPEFLSKIRQQKPLKE